MTLDVLLTEAQIQSKIDELAAQIRTDYGDVPTGHGCAGGSPGLYDMSGDVAEWEDSCSGAIGSSDSCRIRGGSFESSAADLRCDADKQLTRDGHAADVGFRCCL